jgi:hypothetical protein
MKKYHWHVFWYEKLFEKHPQPHCQTLNMREDLVYDWEQNGANKFLYPIPTGLTDIVTIGCCYSWQSIITPNQIPPTSLFT